MLKTHMAACLIATAFVAAPALAQQPPSAATDRPTASGTGTTSSGSPAMQPAPTQGSSAGGSSGAMTQSSGAAGSSTTQPGGATAPSGTAAQSSGSAGGSSGTTATGSSASTGTQPSTSGSAATVPSGGQGGGAMQGQFIAQLQNQQVMASRLIGTTVVSTNNESIGDVNDVILDRQGQVAGVVIGVGGFLGIGEKDVAVPFKALEITASTSQGAMTSNNTGAGAGSANTNSTVATTGSTGGNDQQASASNRQTATTGNTGNAGAGGAAQGNANNDGGVPDRLVLRMTKADLQSAPAFQTSRRGSGDNNASGGSSTNRP